MGNGVVQPLADSPDELPENGEGSQEGTESKDTETGKRLGHADPQQAPRGNETINVGVGGKLSVPREEAEDEDTGEELDVSSLHNIIRRPDRHEWFMLNRAREHPTNLVIVKGEEKDEFYFVAPNLRGPITSELRSVRVFQYYSLTTKRFGVWIVKKTSENSWYESQNSLLKRSPEFFASHQILIRSDKKDKVYRAWAKAYAGPSIVWPTESMADILGEALGSERYITSAEHPIYRDLIDGEELN